MRRIGLLIVFSLSSVFACNEPAVNVTKAERERRFG